MKIKKLSNQFLINYLLVFVLILVLSLVTYYLYETYEFWRENHYSIELDQFLEEYERLGLEAAMAQQQFQQGDFVIVMDRNRQVLEASGGPKKTGETFSEYEFQQLVFGDTFLNNMVFYNEDMTRLFFLHTVFLESSYGYMIALFVVAILVFCLIAIAYAKYTSNQILSPILMLVQGVQEIGQGEYDTHIDFDASNELTILKDEINLMTKKIKAETERRQQLENNRKQLIRDISHDIRTPLTNIMGYSEQLIAHDSFTSSDQQQSIEIIHQYGVAASQLVTELFDLSRLEMKDTPFELVPTDIVETLRLKCIEYIKEFEKRQIQLIIDLPERKVVVAINPIKFQRVLDNLIQNSLKYNKDSFTFYLQLKEESDTYCLSIGDDGIGIPKDYHQSIFEPMVRVEGSRNRQFGGTGLGLAIIKQIVERHGWSIKMASVEETIFDKGCTFIVTIPKS